MVKYFAGTAGERWKVSYIFELGATLFDDTTDNKRTVIRQTKCQRFAK